MIINRKIEVTSNKIKNKRIKIRKEERNVIRMILNMMTKKTW